MIPEGIPLRFVMALVLALVALVLLWALSKRSRSAVSKIDLDDLLLGDDDRLSKAAVVMLGAFGVTTWLIVFLALQGKMTEGYLTIYAAAWIAPTVTKLITATRNPPP